MADSLSTLPVQTSVNFIIFACMPVQLVILYKQTFHLSVYLLSIFKFQDFDYVSRNHRAGSETETPANTNITQNSAASVQAEASSGAWGRCMNIHRWIVSTQGIGSIANPEE